MDEFGHSEGTNRPTVSLVMPPSGPAAGGNTVTITGTNLHGAVTVRFGATPSPSFTVVSSTQIVAVVPPGTGTVQVTVATSAGISTQFIAYTYVNVPIPPVVTFVSPGSGPSVGGNSVTITGTGLTGATAVTFGANPAVSFTVVSPTQITAVAPAGPPGPVAVTVTTPSGTSAPVSYSYVQAPMLTALSPTGGPVAGGNTVTITGTGLTGATAVRFGTTPAAGFTVVSATQIIAVVPPSAPGTVPVTVGGPGGTSNAVTYAYLAAPVLTALSPTGGPVAGGNTVTITGTGLSAAILVSFGTAPAAFTVLSDSQLVATAPPGPAGPVAVTVTTPAGGSPPMTYTRVPAPQI
jgi:hypothetical protein